MGLALSIHRIAFYLYRLIARNVTIPSREITLLREKFCYQPGCMLDKLNFFHNFFHILFDIKSPLRGRKGPTKICLAPNMWLRSSVGRAPN